MGSYFLNFTNLSLYYIINYFLIIILFVTGCKLEYKFYKLEISKKNSKFFEKFYAFI